LLARFGLGRAHTLAADLAVTDRQGDRWGADVVTNGAVLAGFVAFAWIVAVLAGVSVPAVGGVLAVLLGAMSGAFITVVSLWSEADKRRKHFHRVVTLWLRLTSLAMVAGMGMEEAVVTAAEGRSDWAFQWLHEELAVAPLRGLEPWHVLQEMHLRLDVPLLGRVAERLQLTGTTGATARRSLQTQAISARDAELADAKAEANRVSQRLFVPAIVVMLGYIVFIGAPALAQLLRALGSH
jgi:hypothetical protein